VGICCNQRDYLINSVVKQHLLLISLFLTAGITQAETVTLELLNGDSITGTIAKS
jgi:hypothetical protein